MGWESAAGGSDLAQPRAGFVWLFISLAQLQQKALLDLGCAAVCVRVKHLPKLNSAPRINRSFPKFWMLNQELLWMRLKPLTRLDAGSALRWELASADTFNEPTMLPGRERGHRATNHVSSGDIRPQTLYVDCKESTAARSLGNSWGKLAFLLLLQESGQGNVACCRQIKKECVLHPFEFPISPSAFVYTQSF